MPAPRGERLHRSLAGLARSGRPLDLFASEALALLRRAVPHDLGCLATTDPATGLVTRTFKVGLPDHLDAEVARFEYEVDDVNLFRDLVRRPSPVGVLDRDTGGRPERSPRWRELLVPQFGQAHELRAVFPSGGAGWGLLAVFRPPGTTGFRAEEAESVDRVAGLVGAGLRAALVAFPPPESEAAAGPAVLVVGADDRLVQLTAAGERRLAELGGAPGDVLPLPLLSVVAAARAFAAGRTAVPPRLRLRAPSGQWLVVAGAPLAGAGASGRDVVLDVAEARPPDVVPLVAAAFGLTERERDVVHLVLRGADTREIARRLFLSPWTVQDHLKSVFDKSGARSRRELVSRVFLDQYAPRLGSALDASGWFAPAPPPGPRQGTATRRPSRAATIRSA